METTATNNKAGIPCYFGFTTQKQWKSYLKELIKTNDRAVIRGVIQIYNRQTFDEQVEQESNVVNGIGFNKNDAPFMSTVAIAFISGKEVDKKTFEIARNKLTHYWRQLMQISKEGLDDKLREIQERLSKEAKANGSIDDNECTDNSGSGSDSGEDSQGYLFPELFGEAQENPPSSDTPSCGCGNNDRCVNS